MAASARRGWVSSVGIDPLGATDNAPLQNFVKYFSPLYNLERVTRSRRMTAESMESHGSPCIIRNIKGKARRILFHNASNLPSPTANLIALRRERPNQCHLISTWG